jgi:hypothetical protein
MEWHEIKGLGVFSRRKGVVFQVHPMHQLVSQARCNSQSRRRPAGVEGMAGAVEVDGQRCMI